MPATIAEGASGVRLEVLSRLKAAVEAESRELEQAYNERPLSAVAWTARNLLELLIWVDYCRGSEENARRFGEDCARDAVDAINLPDEFSIDDSFSHREARAEIIERAKGFGFDTVDESFTRVSDAAKAVGLGEMFKYSNKLYSKFAHLTALTVMTDMDELSQGFKTNSWMAEGRV